MTSLQRRNNPDPFTSENFSLKFDKDVRLGFIRKVYGILSVQMLFTVAFCFIACLPNLQNAKALSTNGLVLGIGEMLKNNTLMILIIVAYFVSFIALVCCRLDKLVPTNYALLGTFTFCTSWMVAVACKRTQPIIVLEAATLTFSVTFAITVYAMTTKTDFTVFGPLLHICGFVFCTAGMLLAIFGVHMGLLWSVLGVILFSFYLLFDT